MTSITATIGMGTTEQKAEETTKAEPVTTGNTPGVSEKREREEDDDSVKPDAKRAKELQKADDNSWFHRKEENKAKEGEEIEGKKRLPKKKIAMLLCYSGAGYNGMQINPGVKTIEGELKTAFKASGVVSELNSESLNKVSFQRCARTDKNVSAAGQVVSLKINLVETMNKYLPETIRVLGYRRTTQSFNSKNSCSGRQYDYFMPTFAFAPTLEQSTVDYRLDNETLEKVRKVLNRYVGTHNFHNYTSEKKPTDASAKRYMTSFVASDPFMADGMELIKLSVKGQSFMLHQIRKMVGLTIALVRGVAPEDKLEESFKHDRMDVPKAPGLGLVLDQVFFEAYDRNIGAQMEPLTWTECLEAKEAFKAKYIYAEIVKQEKATNSMREWLDTLAYHTFTGEQLRDFATTEKSETPNENAVAEIPKENAVAQISKENAVGSVAE